MANHNVTTLARALTTPRTHRLRRGFPDDGGSAGSSPETVPPGDRVLFSDAELAAAKQLVLLSESSSEDVVLQAASRSSSSASSSSSSLPSVSNARLPPMAATMADEADDEEDGVSTGPDTRRRRYRSIRSLYEVTSPIDGAGERRITAQRGKKSRST